MEDVKFDKIQMKKIWKAMIEAGVIIEKPECEKLRDEQYQLKKRLKNTSTKQSILLMKTVLFFYDKSQTFNQEFKDQRKIFHKKLQDKQKIIDELTDDIKNLQRQNASLESNVKSLKKGLFEESEANHKYKTANKVLNQRLDEKIEVKPAPSAEVVDCYGLSSCVVKAEAVSSDEEINYDE